MISYFKNLRLLLSLPIAILVVGTIGFMILERLSFIDALYFTIVTISTVGYGDIHPTTTVSKLFGIILIIIGIGIFLTIVTNITQMLIQRGQDRLRRQRLNMIIGVFFTEVGNQLLRDLTEFDPHIGQVREDFTIEQDWTDKDFAQLRKILRQHEYAIDPKLMNLQTLLDFLREKGDLLLRQIENPDIIEHEAFTELLWATVHLRDELMSRKNLNGLPDTDLAHLANDTRRVYSNLAGQWLDYLLHLKRRYPYLFSLASRTNPFTENPSTIIE